MKKVLVAGSTGYLGRFVVKALKAKGYWVRAIGRSDAKLEPIKAYADELVIGEVTDPVSLSGVCEGIDIVFSSVGITRQKDGLTYQDVDYQGNRNLLTEAEASGVEKFMYVHVLNAKKMKHVAAVKAKHAFVKELKHSSLKRTVICPTGFFSDMEEFLSMARKGRVYLFGDGENRINPIHGADLAEVCVDAMEGTEKQLSAGGPDVFTYREIAALAFDVLDKRRKVTCVSERLTSFVMRAMRRWTSVMTYGPVEFMATVMTMDVVGEPRGSRRLADHFRDLVKAETLEDHSYQF